MTNRYKKRILIFLLIPILIVILFITDEMIYRLIAAAILLIYTGFIIFLRDSVREEPPADIDLVEEEDKDTDTGDTHLDTDEGEEFKILSKPEKIEVLSGGDPFTPSLQPKRRNYFKPPDLKENFARIASEEIPDGVSQDKQFSFVLEKMLNVAKESFYAHTALFYWYNHKKNRLTLERHVSSSDAINERKLEIEDDVLSKIVLSEEPELLTDISENAESDALRYYVARQGIKSFVGVPLFYGKNLAGILALDSMESDAFGIETIYTLGRIVRVISIIISLFDDKFKDSQAENRLRSLLGVLSFDKKFTTEQELYQALENAVEKLIPWDTFTFVYFNPNEGKFKTSKIVNNTTLKYVGENLEIDLAHTIVGKAILSGMPVKIDDTSVEELPRFTKNEDVSFDGSFLAVPLIYDDENYGVLCFESLKKSIYSFNDVKFIKNATKIFAYILFAYSNNAQLHRLLSHDIETKVLNKRAFLDRFGSDLAKAQEFNVSGAVALIRIDEFLEQESLFEGDPFPKVLRAVADIIKEQMTPMNILGRMSKNIFAVFFFNATTKDVYLWAEKLRIKIARKPVAVVEKQTTFTISVGVAPTTGKDNVQELMNNAELALNKAIEKGGNNVKSI